MDYAAIAASIRSRRRALGLTQAEVALLAGLDRRTLSDFEAASGSRGLSLRNLLSVCEVVGLSIIVAPMDKPTTDA